MPFSAEADGRALAECAVLEAAANVEVLESRMLNPRKIFTHCKLALHITGYRRVPMTICQDLEVAPSWSLEKRQENQNAILTTQVVEKDFTFVEAIQLAQGKEGAAELLSSRISGAVTETRIVGKKLMFKGIFTLGILYRTADGSCGTSVCELPFSQIMEIEAAEENAAAVVRLQFTGCDLQIDGGDPEGRQLAVTLYFHALALVREERTLTMVTDLYSTVYNVTYEAAPIQLTDFSKTMTRRQTVREMLETGVVAGEVLSTFVTCGAVSVSREGSGAVLRTGAAIRVLYLDEGGVPLVAERCVEVSCQLELPENCRVTAQAQCAGDVQSSLSERGIEVRFPVDFWIEANARDRKICIHAAKLDESAPKDLSGAPSLVLRCLGPKETAWDLAKRYNSTISMILSANELESEELLPQEKLLLIPRKRT